MRMNFTLALSLACMACPGAQAGPPGARVGEIDVFPTPAWVSPGKEFLQTYWDEAKLEEAQAKWHGLQERGQATGLMIVHRGFVIREFGDCETPVACHSVRKSILSAIYGAWIEETGTDIDKLLSTKISDVPLSEIGGIPESYQAATVRQLMKSSSGIPLPAEYEPKRNVAARTETPSLPGERFVYNNWDFNALGTVFHKESSRDIFQTFGELVAGPVGMQDFDRGEDTQYYPGEDKKKKSLHPAYLFKLSARDRARLGLLYLAGGVWDGKRIIDEDWFRRSVTDTMRVKKGPLDYGYLWWVEVGGQKLYPFPGDRTYSARGNGGQYIFVVPSRDLVIVHARDTRHGTDFDGKLFNEVFHAVADAQNVGLLKRDVPAFSRKCEVLVPELQKEYKVPGVEMAIIDDGKIVWSREFGVRNAASGEPVTGHTRFEAASMSKAVFAYGVLKLVERGKLDLDRPLAEYLAEPYMENDERHRRITARMVLSHRSGFPNWRKGGYSGKSQAPGLKFEPGTQQGYSGEGFTFLQKTVEEITGLSLDQFTRRTVLEPVGMGQSGYQWDDTAEMAAAHDDEGALIRDSPRYRSGNAGYSMFTTARDYAKFLIEIMKDDRSGEHSLAKETRNLMLRSHSQRKDNTNFALSWVVQPDRRGGYSHTGSNRGFRSVAWFDPETKQGLVIMTNAVGGLGLRDRILEWALDLVD